MKKTIELSVEQARSIYTDAEAGLKVILEQNFTKEELSGNIMDRIKSYEDACAELGEAPLNECALLKAGVLPYEIAERKIAAITRALNEGWKPNWNDHDEYKWFPWFDISSGFAVGVTYCSCSLARAGVASRLCFKSEELAEYAGRQFTDIYKAFMLNQ